jgi:hypothetical protein
MALIAQAATLAGRIPVIHFFDGFRTSHEVAKIVAVEPGHRARHDRRRPGGRAPGPRPVAGASGDARHGPEPGRVLPVAGAGQPLLRRLPGPGAGGHGPLRRTHRPRYRCSTTWAHPMPNGSSWSWAPAPRPPRKPWITSRPGREGGHRQSAAVPPPSPRRPCWPPCRQRQGHRRARPLQGTGFRRRAALQGRGDRPGPGAADGGRPMPRVIGGRYGLASKEFTPGMVKAVFDELSRRVGRGGSSRSASSTTSPTCPWTGTRPSAPMPRGAAARGVLGPGRRRHGVGQQELHQDRRRGHRAAGPGLFRLRLEEVRRGHRVAPALRPGADPLRLPGGGGHGQLRGLPPDRVHRALRPAGPRRAGRRVPAQHAGTGGRCGKACPRPCAPACWKRA